MPFKLGKLAPKYNPKTLKFTKYLSPAIPSPPEKVYREYKIADADWGMFGNDTVGDCTCAAIAHMLMLFTAHTGKIVVPTLDDVIKLYTAVSGYIPGDDSTDNGTAITDVLNYWQTFGLAGHKILGWAQINNGSTLRRAQGVWLFGALDVGVQLPDSAEDQFAQGKDFEIVPKAKIVGGHSIIQPGYGHLGDDFVTWGKGYQKASRQWTNRYMDEAYIVITEDWINEASGLAPNGFNIDELRADLKAIAA